MKKLVKLFNILLVTALYCFAISSATNVTVKPIFKNTKSTEQFQFVSADTAISFLANAENDTIVKNNNSLQRSNFKNPSFSIWNSARVFQQLLQTKFAQYTLFFKNILVLSQKFDLVYPFHYFW
jgi:hypothetical protein